MDLQGLKTPVEFIRDFAREQAALHSAEKSLIKRDRPHRVKDEARNFSEIDRELYCRGWFASMHNGVLESYLGLVTTEEVIPLYFSEEAISWLDQRALNCYWFWRLVEKTTQTFCDTAHVQCGMFDFRFTQERLEWAAAQLGSELEFYGCLSELLKSDPAQAVELGVLLYLEEPDGCMAVQHNPLFLG